MQLFMDLRGNGYIAHNFIAYNRNVDKVNITKEYTKHSNMLYY